MEEYGDEFTRIINKINGTQGNIFANERKHFFEDMQIVYKLFQDFLRENPKATNEEFIKFITNYVNNLRDNTMDTTNSVDYQELYFSFKNLQEKELEEIINNYINRTNSFVKRTKEEKEIIEIIKELIKKLDMQQGIILQQARMSKEYRDWIKEQIQIVLNENQNAIECKLKEILKDSLTTVLKNLQIETYHEQHDELYKKLRMDELMIRENEMSQWYTNEGLDKLNVEQLLALNAFWTNRLIKEVIAINRSLFIINNNQNLLDSMRDSIKKGKEEFHQTYKYDNINQRIRFIKIVMDRLYYNKQKAYESRLKDESSEHEETYKEIDIEEDINEICDQMGRDYERYFGAKLEDDMIAYYVLHNAKILRISKKECKYFFTNICIIS